MQQERNESFLIKNKVGRQLIASVILFINEVELLIYRFLSSGVKNSKRYPRSVELWVDWITSRWALNALTGYRCLDRTSTGKGVNLDWEGSEPQPGREDYWMRESVFDTPRPDLDRIGWTSRPVPQPVEPVGHSLDRLSLLAPKTFLFKFLSFLLLRQGL